MQSIDETRLKTIAAQIFARRGVDFAGARRAVGWSNATWLAGGLALRLSTRAEGGRLLSEARLAGLLPAEVGYPEQVESGISEGLEWVLSREIRGVCLGEVWPGLGWTERASALRQLWQKAEAVHAVDPRAAGPLARQRSWFNSNDPTEASEATRRLSGQGLLGTDQTEVIAAALARFWAALPGADYVLNHGDLTLNNALWREGRVVALLDFEFALLAPATLDLNTLFTCVFGPGVDEPGESQARQELMRCARALLAEAGDFDRLLGYAILLEQWKLEDWLAHPEGEGPLEGWDPYRRLLSLADGSGGYLAMLVPK